jgi:hypothetical protein
MIQDAVADGLSIQHRFNPEPLYKRTGRGSYKSETVAEIAEIKTKKPKTNNDKTSPRLL